MEVYTFRAFYNRRIGMQLVLGYNNDFVGYIGVIMDDVVSHRPYESIASGGGGQILPEADKMSYKDTVAQFGAAVEALERKGFRWRA